MTSNPDIEAVEKLHKRLKTQTCRRRHETDNVKLNKLLKFHLEVLWTYIVLKYMKSFLPNVDS